ncbi:MAG: class I SAM-dependent methyltransferase [Sedimentisphaerales bacterium]|nr:class I SAM-dependent methyltransferase [Sedimentisphaerales bacterium]
MEQERLTERDYWDNRWDKTQLPTILEPTTRHPVAREMLRLFETHLPKGDLSAVEIGGAPGRNSAYLSKYYRYRPSIIEYSESGCDKTRENFKRLGLDVTVYQQDFFGDLSQLPRFDVVMSFGFIEHFSDVPGVLRRHVSLLREGGFLVLGAPNLRGISQKILARTAPEMLARHNLEAMDIRNWQMLEDECGMTALFKGYIGGFQPRNLKRCERRTPLNLCLRYSFKALDRLISPLAFLRRYNSPAWSAHVMGIYKLP